MGSSGYYHLTRTGQSSNMRSGNMYHRVRFYPKVTVRDDYGASSDTWSGYTIECRGEIRYVGGNKELNADERFYAKTMELTIYYRSDVEETMRVQIDNESRMYEIVYIEEIGRKQGLKITLDKLNL